MEQPSEVPPWPAACFRLVRVFRGSCSPIPSNNLLRAVLYADSSLTDQDVIDILNETPGMPTSRDFVEYTYYANGACATMRDQRGVVHEYTYDNWNRVTLDHITDLGDAGEAVDDAVRGIATAYDLLGRTAAITSYGDTNDDGILDVVRNQIQYAYDDYDAILNPGGWGRVATVWQENDGAVNTSTSPNVQYDYDALGRLTSVTDPDGLEVVYDYGAAGSIDNRLSRVAAVTDAADTLEYAAYTYLGAGTIVGSSRELAVDGQNDQTLELTYGTAQNGYSGLDRFGRVVDQLWKLDGVAVDDYSYGYSQAGNRLWKENVVAGDQSVDLDELYSYDELSQLLATERGRLVFDDPNPGDVSLVDEVFGQEWSLDGLGNWVAFDDDGDAQTRQTNAANEITSITGGSVTPAYDAAGNMISGPSPLDDTVQVHYVYDAWNRLVAVYADDSGEPGDLMAQYEYDGFNQRIVKTVYDGEDTTTSEYFYNESWQLLAARTTADTATSATHYVWDLSYVDAPITQLVDANADGDFTDAGDATYYYTFDANQNVTALLGLVETDPGVFEWQVIERYTYTPYGIATAYDADWSNSASPTTDGPLYAGYHFDAETGLYHVRNRQYDPSLGAFTTRDPIGYAAGDANLYRYVGNDPVGAVDPSGLEHGVPPGCTSCITGRRTPSREETAYAQAMRRERQVRLDFMLNMVRSDLGVKNLDEISRDYLEKLAEKRSNVNRSISQHARYPEAWVSVDVALEDGSNFRAMFRWVQPSWFSAGDYYRLADITEAGQPPEDALARRITDMQWARFQGSAEATGWATAEVGRKHDTDSWRGAGYPPHLVGRALVAKGVGNLQLGRQRLDCRVRPECGRFLPCRRQVCEPR